MLRFIETKEVSRFISSYFTVYSKDSRIVKIMDSADQRIVGEAVLNSRRADGGVYIEFIGIYANERRRGYGSLAVKQLKDEYHTLCGWAIKDAGEFWEQMGVIYTDSMKKHFLL